MDITVLFKACVRTIKTRNKALGIVVSNEGEKHTLLKSKHVVRSDFALRSREVLTSISKMRDFLLEHRKDYININNLLYDASPMIDMERDQIDSDAQTFMHSCAEVLRNLRKEALRNAKSPQLMEHQEGIVNILEDYLKAVCKIYSEQKAIRVKRAIDKQNMSRLEPSLHLIKSGDEASSTGGQLLNASKPEEPARVQSHRKSVDQSSALTEEMEFSPEELQVFEKENQRVFEELSTLVDEVRQIEGKVVEISRLQEIFAEKVLQQEQDINRVSDTVVGTTENIKEANEEIREAMKKNAGFRVWILFFLLVLSFSLLFLDWYNE